MAGPSGFFVEFFVSAAMGGLIGVEREHRDDGLPVIAGVRTFPLVAIAGFLTAVMAIEVASPFVIAAGLFGAFGLAYMFMHMRMSVGQTGITTPVTMVITFLLGLAIGYHYVFEAVTVGVVTTALLLTKKRLHRFAAILDDTEILSALQFITLVFILLPLTATFTGDDLPVSWIGRGKLVDPYVILLVSVFVAGISFASLIAMRQIGPHRGIQFSGLMGGLVNSEATTAGLAQRAKEDRRLVGAAVVGSLLASTTMLVRNFAIAAFADTSFHLAMAIAPFFLLIAMVGLYSAWRRRSSGAPSQDEGAAVRVKNPFAVLPALRFALYFAAVSVLVTLASQNLGDAGVYFAALGGFVSAGAVIASLGSLAANGSIPLTIAIRTALLATAASVGGKLLILRWTHRETYEGALPGFALMTAVASVAAALSFFLV
ncbi:MAG TPA: MgtC/SapB family protein [Candidatus Thermoplasmatota archaeon]|nr:MgtC/SapB family protein [Candidatus Thermoplasmatota archaeon]